MADLDLMSLDTSGTRMLTGSTGVLHDLERIANVGVLSNRGNELVFVRPDGTLYAQHGQYQAGKFAADGALYGHGAQVQFAAAVPRHQVIDFLGRHANIIHPSDPTDAYLRECEDAFEHVTRRKRPNQADKWYVAGMVNANEPFILEVPVYDVINIR